MENLTFFPTPNLRKKVKPLPKLPANVNWVGPKSAFYPLIFGGARLIGGKKRERRSWPPKIRAPGGLRGNLNPGLLLGNPGNFPKPPWPPGNVETHLGPNLIGQIPEKESWLPAKTGILKPPACAGNPAFSLCREFPSFLALGPIQSKANVWFEQPPQDPGNLADLPELDPRSSASRPGFCYLATPNLDSLLKPLKRRRVDRLPRSHAYRPQAARRMAKFPV